MTTRVWLGGGNNEATNRNDWSGNERPQPGDDLVINSGTIHVLNDNLAGDVLTLGSGPSAGPVTLDLDGGASVALSGQIYTVNVTGHDTLRFAGSAPYAPTLNLANHASLVITDNQPNFITNLQVSGAGGTLVNNGSIGVITGTIAPALAGTGTWLLASGRGGSGSLTLNGPVAAGQTFAMRGVQAGTHDFSAGLVINDPHDFHGLIDILPPAAGTDSPAVVTLSHLLAISYDIRNDVLSLYDGASVVDTLRVSDAAGMPMAVGSLAGGGVSVAFGMPLPSTAQALPLHS